MSRRWHKKYKKSKKENEDDEYLPPGIECSLSSQESNKQENENKNTMIRIKDTIRVEVKRLKEQKVIDIRRWYEKIDEEDDPKDKWARTTKGITMTEIQWMSLMEKREEIEAAFKKL